MKFSAIIFDLDGTILDNEHQWEEAFRQVYQSHFGQVWGKTEWIHEPGVGLETNWKRILSGRDWERLAKPTWNTYWKLVGETAKVPLMPGAAGLISLAKQKGYKTALATGSSWSVVEAELAKLDLYLAFDVTVAADDVTKPKPDPQTYILTADRLHVDPDKCLVVEDSYAGVESASRAGATVYALTSPYTTQSGLYERGAAKVIASLVEVAAFI